MTKYIAEQLAEHFSRQQFEDLPVLRIQQAKTLIKDYVGVALRGGQTESGRIAARFAQQQQSGDAMLICNGGFASVDRVAFANAIASHSIELDDVDYLALFHFSPPVVSAALAIAQQQKASGRDLLLAVVAGCEVMSRTSHAANFSLRDRGFHTTPTCGTFGAAVAAARLMACSAEQMVSALGLAGAQAAGLMEMYGPSMQKRFNPGPAARSGVTAALLAKLGFTGAATIFEGERGFLAAFTDENDPAALTRDLSNDYPDEFEFKPYSCARPIHNAIDCALNLRAKIPEPVGEIRQILMRRHPRWAAYHQNKHPRTYHEAQVSLPYSVAVALIDGAAFFPQYSPERLSDPQVRKLAELVEITADESLQRGVSCAMDIVLADGRIESTVVDHPKGSIKNPMSQEEMNDKVRLLSSPVLTEEGLLRLLKAIDALDDASSLDELTSALSPQFRKAASRL
ncbi:MAG: MmgE/PrpD family protein [Castellaniella sp.]